LQPNTSIYNESNLFKLEGNINIIALEKSINEIIERHEILRTYVRESGDRPIQVIEPELTISLPVIDLQTYSEIDREAKAKNLITEHSRQPFALDRLPLLRVFLIKLAEREYMMLIIMHHIISDGWSWGVFWQELTTLYSAFCNNRPISLPELPIQYADFALWQRQILNKTAAHQLAYWKQKLEHIPPILELPTDRPRPTHQNFRGGRETLVIPQQLTNKLKDLAKQEGVTFFMLLLTAWKILLYRYSQQTDILVGTPVANRSQIETENLLGCFINTLVLRTNFDGDPNFRELLKQVRETTLQAYAHQDLPFEELVKELQPNRSQVANPLFQVMFVFQETPLLGLQLPDLTITPLPVDNGIAKLDLTLYLEDTKQDLIGFLEYDSDLFDRDTIERMSANWQTLLEGIVTNFDRSISQLPLLCTSEREKLLVEWNETKTNFKVHDPIHHLFEAQVEKTPDAIAVSFEDKQFTYKELNVKANQLAHYLQHLGVRENVLVGICLERSEEMIIGLLAILKAGGAYVPLDPAYPLERLNFMVEDAGLKFILTQQKLREYLAVDRAKLIALDTDSQTIAQYSQTNPIAELKPQSLAYVIYTSGSTGKPKGVQICHSNVVNFLMSMASQPGCDRQDTILAVTSISFDIAVLEIFLPLIVGAKVVLVSREVALDGKKLLSALNNSSATIMQATPATWQLLLEAGWQGNDRLKILCGGEALSEKLAQQLLPKVASLWNMYGPTETTVWSAIDRVKLKSDRKSIAIGHPIANTQIYLLDRNLQPVPIGVPGELHIGGAGLAKGYLNRSELTEEKFILFKGTGNGERGTVNNHSLIYKTGDLARFLPNGKIEYLGRIDHQVKIRGFRIELGEIEAVLSRHQSIDRAIVIVKEDECQQKSLVAYLVVNTESVPSVNDLRSFLRQQLPEYMIPNAFVAIETIPLTPNGKIDRLALSNLDRQAMRSETDYTSPQTEMQKAIAEIWMQILDRQQIGIEENFFELGGHSLLATQVISQLRTKFKVELPLRDLFEAPTISEFSKRVETAIETKSKLTSLPLKPVSKEIELPLSFSQQRLWILDRLEPDSPAYNVSISISLQGCLNLKALQQSIDRIVRRHEILRTSFVLKNGRSIQEIASTLQVSIEIVDLQNIPATEIQTEIKRWEQKNVRQPFDLTKPPLLRLTLLKLNSAKHLLLVTMHHIISDAWSAGIFIREVSQLYEAFVDNKPSPLPELPIQYADFAVWQKQHLQGKLFDRTLAYWKQQLEGAKNILELPTDKPRTHNLSCIGAKYAFSLSPTLSQQLITFSQQEQVTLFMTLLTAYSVLLNFYTNDRDILIGSPIANRNHNEIESLIGFFVNTLVLRTNLSNNPSFRELLQRVKEVALGAYANQDLPFEKLVSELQPERYRDRSPLFQVWFVLQNAPASTLKLPGLNLDILDIEDVMVRHDLKLDLTETIEGIKGFFEYRTDLFYESSIARMTKLFQELLAIIILQPDCELNELVELLKQSDRQQQQFRNENIKQDRIKKLKSIQRRTIK
jgi:amino acid adenylation domain-containing protein